MQPHEVLGGPHDAPREAEAVASVLHPDKNGSGALFNLISEAHKRLTEPAPASPVRRTAASKSRHQRHRHQTQKCSWDPCAPRAQRVHVPSEPPKIIPVGQNTTTIADVNHQWPEVKLAAPPAATPSRASRSTLGKPEATAAVLAAVLNAVATVPAGNS